MNYIPKFEDMVDLPEQKESSIPKFEDMVDLPDTKEQTTLDQDLVNIANKHGIDPEKLRSYAVISGTKQRVEGRGDLSDMLLRGVAGVGETVGLGAPAWLYKKSQDDQTERAMDEARLAIDDRKNYADTIAEVTSSAVNPFGVASRVMGAGTKAAKIGQGLLAGGEGGIVGLSESNLGNEAKSAATGLGIGLAVPAGLEAAGYAYKGAKKFVPGLEGTFDFVNKTTANLSGIGGENADEVYEQLSKPSLRRSARDLTPEKYNQGIVKASDQLGDTVNKIKEQVTDQYDTLQNRFVNAASTDFDPVMSNADDFIKPRGYHFEVTELQPGYYQATTYKGDNKISRVNFSENSDGFLQSRTSPALPNSEKGRNLTQHLYDQVEEQTGKQIIPQEILTEPGKKFWEKRNKWDIRKNHTIEVVNNYLNDIELSRAKIQEYPKMFSKETRGMADQVYDILTGRTPDASKQQAERLLEARRHIDTQTKIWRDGAKLSRYDEDMLHQLRNSIDDGINKLSGSDSMVQADKIFTEFKDEFEPTIQPFLTKEGDVSKSKLYDLLRNSGGKSLEVEDKLKNISQYIDKLKQVDETIPSHNIDTSIIDNISALRDEKQMADSLNKTGGIGGIIPALKRVGSSALAVGTGGMSIPFQIATAPVVDPKMYMNSIDLANKVGSSFSNPLPEGMFSRMSTQQGTKMTTEESNREAKDKWVNKK